MGDYILLKWGTLKGWDFTSGENQKTIDLLNEAFAENGQSASGAMTQHHTENERKKMCEAIDAFDGEISNDWDGETYDKERAKAYIMEHGK